jgi:hypothetical protein
MQFLKANAGKLSIAVVLLGGAIVLFVLQAGGEPSRSGKVQFVCVATGEMFWLERQPRVLPAENPETGQRTLVPCGPADDGSTHVSRRDRGLIEQFERDGVNKYVDSKTLVVRESP